MIDHGARLGKKYQFSNWLGLASRKTQFFQRAKKYA